MPVYEYVLDSHSRRRGALEGRRIADRVRVENANVGAHSLSQPSAVAQPTVLTDRAGFRDASAELLRDLRRAADLGDAQAGTELARKLRAVCARFQAISLESMFAALGSMEPEQFIRQSIIKVAQVQREHGAIIAAPAAAKDLATAKTQPLP